MNRVDEISQTVEWTVCTFNWIIIIDLVVKIKRLSGSTSDHHKVITLGVKKASAICTVKCSFMFYFLEHNITVTY